MEDAEEAREAPYAAGPFWGVGVQSAPAEAWHRLRLAQPPGLLRCSHALVPSSFWHQRMFFLLGRENSSKGVRQNSSEECGEGEAAPSARVHLNGPRSVSKLGRRRALAANRLPSHRPPLAGPPRSRSAGFPWGSHTFVQRKPLRGRRDSRLGESSRVTSPSALLF